VSPITQAWRVLGEGEKGGGEEAPRAIIKMQESNCKRPTEKTIGKKWKGGGVVHIRSRGKKARGSGGKKKGRKKNPFLAKRR